MSLELKGRAAWASRQHFIHFDTSLSSVKESVDEIPRIHVDDVDLEQFIEHFEKPYLPCVILGASDDWVANDKWTPQVSIYYL